MIFSCSYLYAQELPKACKVIATNKIVKLDTVAILQGTIGLEFNNQYEFYYTTSDIFVKDGTHDSIKICYQYIPIAINKPYMHKNKLDYMNNESPQPYQIQGRPGQKKELQSQGLFQYSGLQTNGSLSRSISFGNNQNAYLNSTLNLQIEGKLTDQLSIRASITDKDVPFQPEGNTAQVQDLDNVFIELYKENVSLKAGDVIFQNEQDNHFLKYRKNVQGAMFHSKYSIKGIGKASSSIGYSLSKGKFANTKLEVQEGVLGPYRIQIPNTSPTTIIIANSEKVYVNNQLLHRGFDQDYVIDYNKAEITFTSKTLITKYSRVYIDVEYSDQKYSRGIFFLNHQQECGKLTFGANYYSEKDNKSQPLGFTLGQKELETLYNVGDQLDSAFSPSYNEAKYNVNAILYHKTDTLIDGATFTIFEYTSSNAGTLYSVRFSDVGQGNGNYVLSKSVTNGKIFEWKAPIDGAPQGQYEPISLIPAPNKKDMWSFNASADISEHQTIQTEVAISKHDLNQLSPFGSDDDQSWAIMSAHKVKEQPVGFIKGYYLNTIVSYEHDAPYFSPIDRFRSVEFDRDWSFAPINNDSLNDNISKASIMLFNKKRNSFAYELNHRAKGNRINGWQQKANLDYLIGKLLITGNWFSLDNQNNFNRSDWDRLSAQCQFLGNYISPGYRYAQDKNTVKSHGDTIVSSANYFEEHTLFMKNGDSLKQNFYIGYTYRNDFMPFVNEVRREDKSNTVEASFQLQGNRNSLTSQLAYRNLTNQRFDSLSKETMTGKTEWNYTSIDNALRSGLSYVIGGGREYRKEYIFLPVPQGEGTHTWRDDDGDGVQDLSEFYPAINPDERNYAKFFIPSQQFIFAYDNFISYDFSLSLLSKWPEKASFLKHVSKLSLLGAVSINNKSTDPSPNARLNPFFDHNEADLLYKRSNIKYILFYNRGNRPFSLDIGGLHRRSKQFVNYGFDKANDDGWNANARLYLSSIITLNLSYHTKNTTSYSDYIGNKNYSFQQNKWSPELIAQPSRSFRVSIGSAYSPKRSNEGHASRQLEGFLKGRASQAMDQSLDFQFKYLNIAYSGPLNTPLAYELLEGLSTGNNFTWNVNWQKRLFKGLQLSLVYNGRKSETTHIIHSGKAQVSALF